MKWRSSIAFLMVFLVAACPRGVPADTLRLTNGRVYEGEVAIDGKQNVVFCTDNRYITVDRKDIESLVRTTEKPAPPPPAGNLQTDVPRFTATVYVEQGPLEDLLLRVGQGGVTRKEYKLYLMAEARALGKLWNELDPGERQRAVQQAIDDETLYQGALAAGIHSQPPMRDLISERYRAKFTSDLIKAEDYPEEDRRAFYEANRAAFVMPARVRAKILSFSADTSRKQLHDAWEAARAAPAGIAGWKDFGWITAETEKEMLSREDIAYLLTLGTGEVSRVITDLFGASYFFWVTERQEAEAPSYGEMEKDILERMMEYRRLELQAKFDREIELTRGGLGPEEAVFQRALEAGIHRDWAIRQKIIYLFIRAKKADRDALLADLRKTYQVSRVQED